MIRQLIMLGCVLAIVGCAQEHLPTYPRLGPPQLITAMRDRSRAVRTVSASGIITLTRAGGESVRLDGAIAMQPPDRARLRAWKFGRAVFDAVQCRSIGSDSMRYANYLRQFSSNFFPRVPEQ